MVQCGLWDLCIVEYGTGTLWDTEFCLLWRDLALLEGSRTVYPRLQQHDRINICITHHLVHYHQELSRVMTNCFFCSIFLFLYFFKGPLPQCPGGGGENAATANTNCSHNLPKLNTIPHLYVPDQLRLIMWPNTMEMCSSITLYFKGELWGVCWGFGKNRPRYNGTAL